MGCCCSVRRLGPRRRDARAHICGRPVVLPNLLCAVDPSGPPGSKTSSPQPQLEFAEGVRHLVEGTVAASATLLHSLGSTASKHSMAHVAPPRPVSTSAASGRGSPPVGSPPVAAEPRACRFGAACYNHDPEHRWRFYHPEPEDGSSLGQKRRACCYGSRCYQRSTGHLAQFAHPGDRNYRSGLVVFAEGQSPEFQTLWQLFQFSDPDESGFLSKREFAEAREAVRRLRGLGAGRAGRQEGVTEHLRDLEHDWHAAGGTESGYVNFRKLLYWVDPLALDLPLGLEVSGESAVNQPCRFHCTLEGVRCSCPGFQPAGRGETCRCGHKRSMHRSDTAQCPRQSCWLLDAAVRGESWAPGEEGLVQITDPSLLDQLQEMLTATHKREDNWTRDRGCSLHGVNGCSVSHALKNRIQVPTSYTLVAAYRNQNLDLWKKYSLAKAEIASDCARTCDVPFVPVQLASTKDLNAALDRSCNEWRAFHGSSPEKCRSICLTNFRTALSGTGKTWKEEQYGRGTPLYGFGLYFAERITKADEYSDPCPAGEEAEGLYSVLVCRVIGGRSNIVTTNEIEVDKLRADVFEGHYHSVLGDRVALLGKPYRELVVYDKDQIYPEFLLTYQRGYD